MSGPLVTSDAPVTLIGGGRATQGDLRAALDLAPLCVAADGGARLALDAGVDLAAVIGDMDSLGPEDRNRIPPFRYHPIAEQDSTDFDKALRNIAAPLVLAVGFTGGQMDHGLAALHTLMQRCQQRVVLIGEEDVVFLCPRMLTLPLPPDTRFSLFPLGPVTGRSQGLVWPIDGIGFAPGLRSGTSNRTTGSVSIEVDAAAMLCIVPRAVIQPVVSALLRLPGPARWPARAE